MEVLALRSMGNHLVAIATEDDAESIRLATRQADMILVRGILQRELVNLAPKNVDTFIDEEDVKIKKCDTILHQLKELDKYGILKYIFPSYHSLRKEYSAIVKTFRIG